MRRFLAKSLSARRIEGVQQQDDNVKDRSSSPDDETRFADQTVALIDDILGSPIRLLESRVVL